jgi:miniconductance mechanosensitive channel
VDNRLRAVLSAIRVNDLQTLFSTLASLVEYPWLAAGLCVVALLLLAWMANWITRRILIRGIRHFTTRLTGRKTVFARHGVAERLANAVPALVVQAGIGFVPYLPEMVVQGTRTVAQALVIVALFRAAAALIDVLNELYERRPEARSRPIKGYLQLVKILTYTVCALLILGTLLNRDVLTLLAGLGALAAVLMLVFQSTLLSAVASIQVSSYDMVRVGDWIEMPGHNADGFVTDISLHTVTVQNWDKTITTIPTHRLVTDTFKNWRGMFESGGRRIKRALMLDQTSIRFLDDEERQRMRRFFLIDRYIVEKERELAEWNAKLAEHGKEPVNQRRVTNIGTFRAYVLQYLRNHPGINQELPLIVRQLAPTFTGLPLEIYCFTKDTAWAAHEAVQSDIFDHLLAILPEFGLRVLQYGGEHGAFASLTVGSANDGGGAASAAGFSVR